MKLHSDRVVDTADLRPLWPLTGFVSAEEAIAFKDGCYPDDQPDPCLADFLRERIVH